MVFDPRLPSFKLPTVRLPTVNLPSPVRRGISVIRTETQPSIAPASNRELLSLGMFVFGMDTMAYSELQRRMDWRHAKSERFGARAAAQYVGPGEDTVTLTGLLVPEIAGSYASIDRLIEMAGSADSWPLIDGKGNIWGEYRILAIDQRQQNIMAGGFARTTDFAVDLERAD